MWSVKPQSDDDDDDDNDSLVPRLPYSHWSALRSHVMCADRREAALKDSGPEVFEVIIFAPGAFK